MPPANSPNREPTPSTFASALRGLESPVDEDVLNLAATLTTQLSDGDAGANMLDEARASLRYLRTTQEHDRQRLEQSRERLRQLERARDDLDHGDRLRRSMDRLHRLHDSSAATPSANANAGPTPTSTAQYGERVPSQNSLYDWSPLPHVELADDDDERSLRALQARLRMTSNPSATADSLRSTAILQAVRRHPRFSARTRDYLLRYNQERDRETMRDAAREAPPHPARDTASLRRSTQDLWAGPRERYQAARSLQSPPHSHPPSQPQLQSPPVAPMLEHTVKYLARLRHATTVDESLNCALDAGFLSKDYFCVQYPDFVTDTLSIPPPQATSWLAPGAVLSGCQHATPSMPTSALATAQLPPPSRPWLSTSYSTPRSLTSYLSPSAPPTSEPPHLDRWPVKVTIHAVDWSDMSLSGTMEAYNVPSHPHQHSLNIAAPSTARYTRTSSITTYLEGEILDFNTHSLVTESFKSDPATDTLYWRKLPPFRDMEDEDVVKALTSKKWWEGLSREYVLMRWKEKCFVKPLQPRSKTTSPSSTPTGAAETASASDEYYTYDSHTLARHTDTNTNTDTDTPNRPSQPRFVDAEHAAFDDSGCGLTISGFYYICLRRSDGRVDGLYYDPMSSPYQCLQMESQPVGRFGSWAFA